MERNTKQQQIILEVISTSRIHPTMKQLQQLIAKRDATIGQATIYRTINRLVEKGIVQKISDTNEYRYDVNYDHDHFKCLQCGKIEDIYLPQDKTILSDTLKPRTITKVEMMIYGICEECQKRKKEL